MIGRVRCYLLTKSPPSCILRTTHKQVILDGSHGTSSQPTWYHLPYQPGLRRSMWYSILSFWSPHGQMYSKSETSQLLFPSRSARFSGLSRFRYRRRRRPPLKASNKPVKKKGLIIKPGTPMGGPGTKPKPMPKKEIPSLLTVLPQIQEGSSTANEIQHRIRTGFHPRGKGRGGSIIGSQPVRPEPRRFVEV